jgi:AraC-like DNA-binding protein
MENFTLRTNTSRPRAILNEYLHELDKHMADLREGKLDRTFEIRDFAEILHIHPRHLSNTIQEVLGESPCSLYENRLMNIAKQLLRETDEPIAEVARRLTYDPSNFTKFFKRFAGITPKQYRAGTQKF